MTHIQCDTRVNPGCYNQSIGVIDTVKELGILIQKIDNLDLIKRMVELQQQVYALDAENRELKDANRALKERFSEREQMVFRKNSYWKGDEGPFCPRCFDAEALSVRMLVNQGYSPQCPKCHTVARDPDAAPPKPIRVRHSNFMNRDRERF